MRSLPKISAGAKISTVEYGAATALGKPENGWVTVMLAGHNDYTMRIHTAEIINVWRTR